MVKFLLNFYLITDHDMGDFSLAVYVFMLFFISEDGKHKVSRFTLTLSHQEAAGFTLLRKELFSIFPRKMPMIPPDTGKTQQ